MILSGCVSAEAIDPFKLSPIPTTIQPSKLTTNTSTPSPTIQNTPTASPTATLTPSPSPTATWVTIGPGAVEAPILLYHHIEPAPASLLYRINTETFENHLSYLSAHGYHTITLAQLRQAILDGMLLPPKPVIITFDDGNVDNYEYAFPIMQKYGFTGTVYIVANRLGAEGYLSIEQLQELAAAGWEIGSHSMTHLDLANAPPQQLRQEIISSRLHLEKEIGVDVRSFAYPFGAFTSTLGKKVENYGYRTGVGLGKNSTHDRGTIYYLSRHEILGTMTMDDFKVRLGVPNLP